MSLRLSLAVSLIALSALGARAQVDAASVATDKIRDLTAQLRVADSEMNSEALQELGGAFATSYRIPRYDVWYKFPGKARFEGKAGILSGTLIYNGNFKKYQVGFIRKKKDVTGKPGEKQGLMDLGIFSKDWVADYNANFVKKEGANVVFKLTQRNSDSDSYEIVTVDPKTHITVKRLSYGGDGRLRKDLRYVKPQAIAPGIWVPTRVELFAPSGKKAGAQVLVSVAVNKGVAESRFAL
jgi:outer membrane lipoprotein-sorting protein